MVKIPEIEWQKWLIVGLTTVIIPWGIWVTVSVYAADKANAMQQINIEQLKNDNVKLSSVIDRINDNLNQMKNEQVRQGVILENIQKQLSFKTNLQKDYALKGIN